MTRASDFVPLNGISRRTFCKGAAVLGIWGGLASFGLAGCAPRTRAERLASSAPWKAGTYTAEVTGRNAPYAMTVTFTDDAIGCTNIMPSPWAQAPSATCCARTSSPSPTAPTGSS